MEYGISGLWKCTQTCVSRGSSHVTRVTLLDLQISCLQYYDNIATLLQVLRITNICLVHASCSINANFSSPPFYLVS